MSHRTRPLASKWTALVVGLSFAIPGLLGVVTSIPQFNKFAVRQWIEPRPYSSRSVTFSGFDPGSTALFCLAVFSVGVGVAASPFLGVIGRRNVSLLLAVLWHGLGIATGVWFLKLAPRPLSLTPLLGIAVFEWLGLFPLALGISKESLGGRSNSAVWNAWAGAVPGAVGGGIVGFVIDYVRFGILGHSRMNGFAIEGWIVGILAGGLVSGLGFFVWGWRHVPPPKTEEQQQILNH